jgi:putative ATP-dependent endonuclease of OLD family
MYLSELKIKNFRQFGDRDPNFSLRLQKGVTALIGENDAGKTAVIDAIRHVLLGRDGEVKRLQHDDFHIGVDGIQAAEITIVCKLSDLDLTEKGAFAEYLTYEGSDVSLYIHWEARRLSDAPGSRRWVDVSVRSGPNGEGPSLDSSARQLLSAAYLRPLRDAEREMSPGRGSRLSQILHSFPGMSAGEVFDKDQPPATSAQAALLSLVGLSDYLRHLVEAHAGVTGAQNSINTNYLGELALAGEKLHGRITFAEGGSEAARLRQILERLELGLLEGPAGHPRGRFGLGSNNLLFMACELLLIGKEQDGLPLLLIEEPEAHLHPQRQLRLMEFLESATKAEGDRRAVQVIVTTHSPNLASKISLKNLVLLQGQRAFSLNEEETELAAGDYRFLERFLDVTKANLFFARGLLIVEGDSEAILLPTLAALLGHDLTEHGVSIVNVGGVGLRRYSRILQRKHPEQGVLCIPVACITDLDVMPDCAPLIVGKVACNDRTTWNTRRKWRITSDFGVDDAAAAAGLKERENKLKAYDGQYVRTFVSSAWTLEYSLCHSGLVQEVHRAATLAANDDHLNDVKKERADVETDAQAAFDALNAVHRASSEALYSHVMIKFTSKQASKAIAAQYLAEELKAKFDAGDIDKAWLEARIPSYIKDAIVYATTPISEVEPAEENAPLEEAQ